MFFENKIFNGLSKFNGLSNLNTVILRSVSFFFIFHRACMIFLTGKLNKKN